MLKCERRNFSHHLIRRILHQEMPRLLNDMQRRAGDISGEASNLLRLGNQPNDSTVTALQQMLTQAFGRRAAFGVDDE